MHIIGFMSDPKPNESLDLNARCFSGMDDQRGETELLLTQTGLDPMGRVIAHMSNRQLDMCEQIRDLTVAVLGLKGVVLELRKCVHEELHYLSRRIGNMPCVEEDSRAGSDEADSDFARNSVPPV